MGSKEEEMVKTPGVSHSRTVVDEGIWTYLEESKGRMKKIVYRCFVICTLQHC